MKQTKLKAVIKIILIVMLLIIINRNDGSPWSRKIEMGMQKTTLMDSESILQKILHGIVQSTDKENGRFLGK